jgi:hypothetical protein
MMGGATMNSAISKIENKSNIMDMSNISGPPMFEDQPSQPYQDGIPDLGLDRRVPSELKSRPKIPRTPAEGQREDIYDQSINLRDNDG